MGATVDVIGVELPREVAGLLAVLASVILFGSFTVPLKFPSVVRAQVDPGVFQAYMSIPIFLSSWLVLLYNEFHFTYYGIIGASLWVPASLLSVAAVQNVGMAVGMGVWAGTTIVVSFLWGSLVFHEDVRDVGLAVLALVLLVIGIAMISFSGSEKMAELNDRFRGQRESSGRPGSSAPQLSASGLYASERTHLIGSLQAQDIDSIDQDEPEPGVEEVGTEDPQRRPVLGLACALLLGILNGSMMVPLRSAPSSNIEYIVSFSIGVMAVTPPCVLGYYCLRSAVARRIVWPEWKFRAAFLPAMLTGFMWQVGNYFATYATLILGLAIGFPLTQLAMVVSGLWGILLYREVKGAGIGVWVLGLIILGAGAALLTLYG